MSKYKSQLAYFFLTLAVIVLISFFGPEEKSLGAGVRIVYLHGAWVLTAELAFVLSGIAGLFGLVMRRDALHDWSAAFGRTGIVFWITYLPLSLWAMQANWNGLFLAEPRFRLAIIFTVTGVLLQLGLWFMDRDWVTSLSNIVYVVVLLASFAGAEDIMHPGPSPIFSSGNAFIIGFFLAMIALAFLSAYFLTRMFLNLKQGNGTR